MPAVAERSECVSRGLWFGVLALNPNDVLNPLEDFQGTSINRVPYLAYLNIIIPAITPKDRPAPGEVQGVTPVLPSPKNLKDIVGGVPGVLKGIVVDNVLPIYGALPFGSSDQPFPLLDFTIEAALAVAEVGRSEKRTLATFDQWPDIERQALLKRLQDDFRLRAGVASTVEGRAFLASREIALTQNDLDIAAALQMRRERSAKKAGGSNPVVAAIAGAAGAVVDGITQLDRLFAANPPDP